MLPCKKIKPCGRYMRECLGKVLEVDEKAGVGRILQEGIHGRVRPFTLDTVQEYRGERLRKLKKFSKKGLAPRVVVKFDLDESADTIERVKPLIFRFSF